MVTPSAQTVDEVRAEIAAAQQAFEEDVKRQGLYVTHDVKLRYAAALSKSNDKEDWMLARWYVPCRLHAHACTHTHARVCTAFQPSGTPFAHARTAVNLVSAMRASFAGALYRRLQNIWPGAPPSKRSRIVPAPKKMATLRRGCSGTPRARSYFNDLWKVGHEVRRSRLEMAKLHLKLGDFRKCRQMCQQLIALPSSRGGGGEGGEGKSEDDDVAEIERLHEEVVARVRREGKIGLAAVAAIVAVFGAIVLWSRRRADTNNNENNKSSN
jgi:hypothetical protein